MTAKMVGGRFGAAAVFSPLNESFRRSTPGAAG
jgi:hypothetical protein